MGQNDDLEFEVGLTDTLWAQMCERGHLHCRYCGEQPRIEDLEAFADFGLCGDCAAAEDRWSRY